MNLIMHKEGGAYEFSHNSRARELTLAKCTSIMVILLKAWKLTVEGIECDDAAF